MDVEKFFEEQKGITVDAAMNAFAKYTAIDLCRFAQKYHEYANDTTKKEGRSIFTFKKGDVIIRLKPRIITERKVNDNLGIEIEVVTGIDNSFRYPHEFMGIENNQIYLKHFKSGLLFSGNLEDFTENWGLFIVPDGLTMKDCI